MCLAQLVATVAGLLRCLVGGDQVVQFLGSRGVHCPKTTGSTRDVKPGEVVGEVHMPLEEGTSNSGCKVVGGGVGGGGGGGGDDGLVGRQTKVSDELLGGGVVVAVADLTLLTGIDSGAVLLRGKELIEMIASGVVVVVGDAGGDEFGEL